MNDIIEIAKQKAESNGKYVATHDLTVSVTSKTLVDGAIQSWGKALGNSRGAPNWSRIEPFIKEIDEISAEFRSITDNESRGAIEFKFSDKQKSLFNELKMMLTEIAEKVETPKENIDLAQKSFDQFIMKFEFSEEFEPEMGSLTIASFLEKTAELQPIVTHPKYGELNAKSLVSLSKIKAPVPETDGPQGDDAIAAQMPRHVPIADGAQYRSMGQMVKAEDSKALSDYIDESKNKKTWDESKVDACSKLGFIAAGQGSLGVMRVLLEKGDADVDYPNQGLTPLMMAIANNHPDMIDLLIAKGANRRITPVDGRSLLMLAASHDAVDSIKKLHSIGGFDINETSLEGRTALHHAALGEDEKTSTNAIKTLMELGADPTIIDWIGDDGGLLAEQYVDEENDDAYAQLSQYRKDWEAGKTGPLSATSGAVAKARAILGF